jgi:hypothetical protein
MDSGWLKTKPTLSLEEQYFPASNVFLLSCFLLQNIWLPVYQAATNVLYVLACLVSVGGRQAGKLISTIALQGGFHEHLVMLRQTLPGIEAVEVRSKADLEDPRLDGLVIPGGESTTMAIIAQRSGAWESLQNLVRSRPVWVSLFAICLLVQLFTNE